MGVTYAVAPLGEAVVEWLDELGVAYPDSMDREPTPSEIKRTLQSQTCLTFELAAGADGCICIDIKTEDEARWTRMWLNDAVDDAAPCVPVFEKGCELLIIEILGHLASQTGPFVLIPDTGELAVVVESGVDFTDIERQWIEARGDDT